MIGTAWAQQAGAASGPSNVDVTAPDFNEYPEDYDELAASEIAAITAENILPERYANGSTSGLEVDVVAEGENVHNFDLEG